MQIHKRNSQMSMSKVSAVKKEAPSPVNLNSMLGESNQPMQKNKGKIVNGTM